MSWWRSLSRGAKHTGTTVAGGVAALGVAVVANPEQAAALLVLLAPAAAPYVLPAVKILGTAMAAGGVATMGVKAADAKDTTSNAKDSAG